MDDSETIDKLLDERLRPIQIINAALLAGVLFFTGFVLFGHTSDKPPEVTGQLTYAVVAICFVVGLVWLFVPARLADRQVTKIANGTWTPPTRPPGPQTSFAADSEKLLFVYQSASVSVPHFSKARPSSRPQSTWWNGNGSCSRSQPPRSS
jgi:hypothetical protein